MRKKTLKKSLNQIWRKRLNPFEMLMFLVYVRLGKFRKIIFRFIYDIKKTTLERFLAAFSIQVSFRFIIAWYPIEMMCCTNTTIWIFKERKKNLINFFRLVHGTFYLCFYCSVKTEILDKGANSSLLIAKINKSDSGNYSCFINATHEYTVSVHVLNGKPIWFQNATFAHF